MTLPTQAQANIVFKTLRETQSRKSAAAASGLSLHHVGKLTAASGLGKYGSRADIAANDRRIVTQV